MFEFQTLTASIYTSFSGMVAAHSSSVLSFNARSAVIGRVGTHQAWKSFAVSTQCHHMNIIKWDCKAKARRAAINVFFWPTDVVYVCELCISEPVCLQVNWLFLDILRVITCRVTCRETAPRPHQGAPWSHSAHQQCSVEYVSTRTFCELQKASGCMICTSKHMVALLKQLRLPRRFWKFREQMCG